MNIEEEFKKFLHEWVKKNFGQSEADDPSWSIEALAHDLKSEYVRLKEREDLEWVKEDVELEDGGQMMTSEYIKDLEPEEIAQRLLEFWGYTDDSLDWAMVEC